MAALWKEIRNRFLEDVLDGFCSPEQAHDVYGVVIDLNTETIDIGGTNQRRAELEVPA